MEKQTLTQGQSAATTQGENAHVEPVNLRKRIGSTTYVVSVHFSKNEAETMADKLLRMIECEVKRNA